MNDGIVGVGIDLTQHIPLVSVAVCPAAVRADGSVDVTALARHWPPKVELCQFFRRQLPSAVLPLVPGEPLLSGDLAARHRRSSGLAWPPEAQVPYSGDPACGVGRIPLVAAWAALLPFAGTDQGLARLNDPEFTWHPDGRKHSASAGHILAASVKAFLGAARVPLNFCRTAVVVPDALGEAGQQILLDGLTRVGIGVDKVHLLPRPLAVALQWCYTTTTSLTGTGKGNEEGTAIGRLRLITTALDVWEAISLELRARWYGDREWIVPVRDRPQLADVLPELPILGFSAALALAYAEANGERFGWWSRMCASDWLARRLSTDQVLSSHELQTLHAACWSNPPETLQQELNQISTLKPLWSRLFRSSFPPRDAIRLRWESQERDLGTDTLPCVQVLVDGAFSNLFLAVEEIARLAAVPESVVRVPPPSQFDAVSGAALAAAAISHGLPCYRETLLPLDLYVRATDEYGDPKPQWKELVVVRSVEAGQTWRSPIPVAGLQIKKGQDRLSLPLRRELRSKAMFRRVSTELATPATRDEPVQIKAEVKPGQGFARVCIESITPGVFATQLDWSTMEECEEPKPPPLHYLPGVSRVIPNREMFERARPILKAALRALTQNSPVVEETLRDAIVNHLNKWPLAHDRERRRGRIVPTDFMLHYGVIGSDGNLDELPEPDLIQALRQTIGKNFGKLVRWGNVNTSLGKTLLRASGWFYLAMPKECFDYLRSRLTEARYVPLSAEELHAIGLAFEHSEDLCRFYPLALRMLRDFPERPNNWLRAVRNICRFRNHALHPDAISDSDLSQLTEQLFTLLKEQVAQKRFGLIFRNCLETIPFLLKRRRYNPKFLDPHSSLAQQMIDFLEELDRRNHKRLPQRLQKPIRSTIKFLRGEATKSDIDVLLSMEDENDEYD